MTPAAEPLLYPFVPIQHLSKMKECVICRLLLTGQMNGQGTEALDVRCMFLSTARYVYQYTGWDNTLYSGKARASASTKLMSTSPSKEVITYERQV